VYPRRLRIDGHRPRIVLFALACAVLGGAALATAVAPSSDVTAFKTSRAALLVPLREGVQIDPILSTGDVVGGQTLGYQMSGVPDGLGAYRSSRGTIELFMNHELEGIAPEGVGARVSHLTLTRRGHGVLAGRYEVDGTQGFASFCSSSLALLDGVPYYTTGEENTGTAHAGMAIVLDGQTGRWREAPWFGHFAHEQVLAVKGVAAPFFVLSEDGPAGFSQLYAYSAPTWQDALSGHGQLLVWKADGAVADGNPSTNDIARGETLSGSFVPIDQSHNTDTATLEAYAQSVGAFDLVRMEDAAQSKTDPHTVYFSDTGSLGAETVRGRIYRLTMDASDPLHASLTAVLDGDAGDDIVNPDNLDASAKALVIQEDRNSEHRDADVAGGYSRVLVYRFAKRALQTVARVDTPATLRPGDWESSGVLDAHALLGSGWWLLDVQAHGTAVLQPGLNLDVDSGMGEDGQLLAIRIPNT
jgi:hypothetical protein